MELSHTIMVHHEQGVFSRARDEADINGVNTYQVLGP